MLASYQKTKICGNHYLSSLFRMRTLMEYARLLDLASPFLSIALLLNVEPKLASSDELHSESVLKAERIDRGMFLNTWRLGGGHIHSDEQRVPDSLALLEGVVGSSIEFR